MLGGGVSDTQCQVCLGQDWVVGCGRSLKRFYFPEDESCKNGHQFKHPYPLSCIFVFVYLVFVTNLAFELTSIAECMNLTPTM